MSIRNLLINYFPFLGICKRILKSISDILFPSKSYSQHGEDQYIFEFLTKNKSLKGIYIDVGANHPTSISNTYLFYRMGFSGINIEPNDELAKLHRWFRKRDIVFVLGIDNVCHISKFNISKTPVLSSFKPIVDTNLWKTKFVPVFTLDEITKAVMPEKIFLLSIDTEGLNYNVIQAAENTLKITDVICIEVDNELEEIIITEFLTKKHCFRKINKMGCNLIFVNECFE